MTDTIIYRTTVRDNLGTYSLEEWQALPPERHVACKRAAEHEMRTIERDALIRLVGQLSSVNR